MLLNCHSYYSLRYGTFSEEELLQYAQHFGYSQIALTDINNTSACLNFLRLAPKYHIRPILGIDFRNGSQQNFVGLAQNNKGFQELNVFLSYHSHQKITIPEQAPEFENAFIIYPLERVLEMNKKTFLPNEFIGIRWEELNKIRFSGWFHLEDKIVLLQSVSFRNKKDFNLHRIFRAIDHNSLLSKLPAQNQGRPEEIMLPSVELQSRLKNFPFILRNTKSIMEQCELSFGFGTARTSQNKSRYSESPEADIQLLKSLCEKGLHYRYPQPTKLVKTRIEKEMKLIQQMDFVPFFLINWDIIRYARHKGYYHVGRGSGANSIIAYLLGITDVDPIELDLYFERFMNLYRANPPDFDIDFSWRDREDVTRYIFERFGKDGQTALLATYNTFQHSAAIREIGKVFGLPKHEMDVLSKGRYEYNQLDSLSQLAHRYAQYMHGMPNYLSIHSGGILIAEKPIHYYSATDLPPKGFPTTQFDMVIAEDVGLYKYDILGQRGLGKIKDAIQLVCQNQPDAPEVDIHNVKAFIEDPNINQMVSRAECIGCFYVESPAMRMLLRKLEVNTYLGLVAASSIIRPGVAKSGMMREYILRHKNPDRRKEAHPIMWELMPETYGVMVYQEDVIKVAHYFAGLDLGEADVLRRGMSGKFRSREEFQKVEQKFFTNCREKGYEESIVQEIWKQIESFAGYAFAKGHSASYAVESYQSLYLKHYYPLEYMVATLNNGGGFYRPEFYIHEARMCSGVIHPPHVNYSRYETTIHGKDIYLGFHFLQGLETKLAYGIAIEREQRGSFTSLKNFIDRFKIGIESLDHLIRVNAFSFTGENKRHLLWKAHLLLAQKPPSLQQQLFKPEQKKYEIPPLPLETIENTFDEIELLGFPLSSPFDLLEKPIVDGILARNMSQHLNESVVMYGHLVTVKNTKTHQGKRMNFGTFLDKEGQWIDTVHFPPVVAKYPFRASGIYKLIGKVVQEFDFLTLEVQYLEKLPYVQDPRYRVEDFLESST